MQAVYSRPSRGGGAIGELTVTVVGFVHSLSSLALQLPRPGGGSVCEEGGCAPVNGVVCEVRGWSWSAGCSVETVET